MTSLTPLGLLVERARERRGLSKRRAAMLAGISEGRWRQVVTGVQKVGGTQVPANPRPETVVRMARAVGVDLAAALDAAGMPRDWAEQLADVDPAIAEVEASDLPADVKQRILALLRQESR